MDEVLLAPRHHYFVVSRLMEENNVKTFAEIGVFKGRLIRKLLKMPVINMIREYWAIDQWKPYTEIKRDQEFWDSVYQSACRYYPWFSQLRIVKLSSEEASELFWPGFFDMVYIDANHRAEWVLKDIKAWLPLIKKGGIIAGHDYSAHAPRRVKGAVDGFFGEGNFVLDQASVWWKKID